jgi:hypothetical protein
VELLVEDLIACSGPGLMYVKATMYRLSSKRIDMDFYGL